MGNVPAHLEPSLKNVNSDVHQIPGFCTEDSNDTLRAEWCEKLGQSGEWEFAERGPPCFFNPDKPYSEDPQGEPGRGVICRRKNYLNDPTQCCIRSKPGCRPNGPHCRPLLRDWCSESPARWIGKNSPCIRTLNQMLDRPDDLTSPFFKAQVRELDSSVDFLRPTLEKVDLSSIHPTEDVLFSICRNYPQLCSSVLTERSTKEDLPIRWSGCYRPDEYYQRYFEKYGLSRECTPSCARTDVVPSINRCQQNICIIDSVTSQLEKNDSHFERFCAGCTGPDCTCILEGSSPSDLTGKCQLINGMNYWPLISIIFGILCLILIVGIVVIFRKK